MKTEPILLFYLLVASFIGGFSLGLGRDLLLFVGRILSRLLIKPSMVRKRVRVSVQLVQDLLFCLLIGCVLIVILFYYSEGRIRVFSVMAMLLGLVLYRQSIGRLFCRFSVRIADKVAYAISWLFRCLTKPLLRLFAWIFQCAAKPIRVYTRKIKERRLEKYSATRTEELRKISKEGFINIEWKTYGV